DLVPREDALRLRGEERQEPELRPGQVDRLAGDHHLVAGEVDADVPDLLDSPRRDAVELPAAAERADAADQLGDRRRRRDVFGGNEDAGELGQGGSLSKEPSPLSVPKYVGSLTFQTRRR